VTRRYDVPRTEPRALARALLGAVLVATALATAAPVLVGLAPGTADARQALVPLPLSGAWRTIANGDRINKVLLAGDEIWTATDRGGVVKWNRPRGTWRQYLAPQDGLLSNIVSDIVMTGDGVIWAATPRGLARYDAGLDRFEVFTPSDSPGMPARVVTALAPAPDGKLWVGFSQEWDAALVDPKVRTPGAFRKGGLALYAPSSGVWEAEYHVEYTGSWDNPRYSTLPSENVVGLAMATDGVLWIATDTYLAWDENTCTEADCPNEKGYWVPIGGGLAATKGTQWQNWNPGQDKAGGCYPTLIRDFAPDHDGWMWVATGEGLYLMRNGLQKVGCEGMVRYTRARGSKSGGGVGMRGNQVFSVDVDAAGHVWVGHGESLYKGAGLGILDYGRSVDDWNAWNTDDAWEFIDLDSRPGVSVNLITALRIDGAGKIVLGTRNHRAGDGDGLRVLDPTSRAWTALRTAADGLPGNQITDIKRHPTTGDLWVATSGRGVARFDGAHWTGWRMFASTTKVASTLVDANKGISAIPVDIPDKAAFDRIFPTYPRYVHLGSDTTMYRITGYTPASTAIKVTPALVARLPKGSAVLSIARGPASDVATQIAIDASGNVWVGGRETVWQANCPGFPYCWLDGGLGKFDGAGWTVYSLEPTETGLLKRDQEVASVEVDGRGRVWAGTGNAFDGMDGKGIFVLDPATSKWTLYDVESVKAKFFAGDGIGDMDRDPTTGDMWVGQHAVEICANNSPFGDACSPSFSGGGVSHFNGSTWEMWSKKSGAKLKGVGAGGNILAIAVDRTRGRVWAGGYDAAQDFHWPLGRGVNAVVNWCPLAGCTNDAWTSQVWPDDGAVTAIEMDDTGNVWVGTHRYGNGLIPPTSGVKVFDGTEWRTYNADNSGLPSSEISALDRDAGAMWVGTLRDGLSQYIAVPPPVTPVATRTPRPSSTPFDEATPTPGPTNTRRATPSPTGTRITATPSVPTPAPGGCEPGEGCSLYLPHASQRRVCGPECATGTTTPGTPTGTAGTPTPTRTAGTPARTPTGATPTPTRTAGTPTPTRTAGTPTKTSGTPTRTPTPTRTAGTPAATGTAGTPTRTPTPAAAARG
jgi:ligand-binding sensor domain-containing protein